MAGDNLRWPIGSVAVVAPILHTATDLAELIQGGFSPAMLYVNYVAFLAVPFYAVGLHAHQQRGAGWIGLAGAVAYGAAFIFYAGTTLYALVRRSADYAAMIADLGAIYWAHGALMVVGGAMFGIGVLRARVLPRWTGVLLLAAMLLHAILAAVPLPEISQIAASTVRNAAFVGMGAAVLRRRPAGFA